MRYNRLHRMNHPLGYKGALRRTIRDPLAILSIIALTYWLAFMFSFSVQKWTIDTTYRVVVKLDGQVYAERKF